MQLIFSITRFECCMEFSLYCDGVRFRLTQKRLCYSHLMFSDSYIVAECIIGRGSFGGLMALYESNFIKFRRLAGNIASSSEGLGEYYLSAVPKEHK